jgi:hypothetical protein
LHGCTFVVTIDATGHDASAEHSTDSTTHSTASANDIDNASATADGWASHEW